MNTLNRELWYKKTGNKFFMSPFLSDDQLKKFMVATAADPITFVGAETAVLSNGANPTVALPEGVQDGDLLIAAVYHNVSGGTITPPAGWTELYTFAGIGATCQGNVYYKIADGETGPYQFTAIQTRNRVNLCAFRGVNQSNPIAAVEMHDMAEGDAIQPHSMPQPIANDGSMVVHLHMWDTTTVRAITGGTAGWDTIFTDSIAPSQHWLARTYDVGFSDKIEVLTSPTAGAAANIGATIVLNRSDAVNTSVPNPLPNEVRNIDLIAKIEPFADYEFTMDAVASTTSWRFYVQFYRNGLNVSGGVDSSKLLGAQNGFYNNGSYLIENSDGTSKTWNFKGINADEIRMFFANGDVSSSTRSVGAKLIKTRAASEVFNPANVIFKDYRDMADGQWNNPSNSAMKKTDSGLRFEGDGSAPDIYDFFETGEHAVEGATYTFVHDAIEVDDGGSDIAFSSASLMPVTYWIGKDGLGRKYHTFVASGNIERSRIVQLASLVSGQNVEISDMMIYEGTVTAETEFI